MYMFLLLNIRKWFFRVANTNHQMDLDIHCLFGFFLSFDTSCVLASEALAKI